MGVFLFRDPLRQPRVSWFVFPDVPPWLLVVSEGIDLPAAPSLKIKRALKTGLWAARDRHRADRAIWRAL